MNPRGDFTRQSFLGAGSEQKLANTRVAIVGLGGGGSHVAQQLAHVGIGDIRLIDPQEIEDSNLNRLIGATENDVSHGTPKVEIAKRVIKAVRPWIKVEVAQTEWQNANDLIKDVHILIGCVDGYKQRMYLEGFARRYCLPYIDIGMDVIKLDEFAHAIAGQMILTFPRGPCMKCLGFLKQAEINQEEDNYGDAGINPQVVWTNGVLASLAVGACVRLLTPWFAWKEDYEWLEVDGNSQTIIKSDQPKHSIKGKCEHYSNTDVGDTFFKLNKAATGE